MIIRKYLSDDLKEFKDYQLCYVDTVPETYSDYDEDSKRLMQTEEYKQYVSKRNEYFDKLREERKAEYGFSWISSDDYHDIEDYKFTTRFTEYPHEDFEAGYTHYLYFTSDMNEQWGDDWDDAPYEYNAEIPYYDKTNVLVIPVTLNNENLMLPCDYGINSPFSVERINAGAIPWIWFSFYKEHKLKGIAFNGGDSLEVIINKFKQIEKL